MSELEVPLLVRLWREINGEPFATTKTTNSEIVTALTSSDFILHNLAYIVAKRRGIQVVKVDEPISKVWRSGDE